MTHKKTSSTGSNSSYASLQHPDISSNLSTMLATRPIADSLYLCETSTAQQEVEDAIRAIYTELGSHDSPLAVDSHLRYLEHFLQNPLPPPFASLDSSHSWMVYWLVNGSTVLGGNAPDDETKLNVSHTIAKLVIDGGKGGIAGGPNGQIGHAASTYAAVLALALVGDWSLLRAIRENLYEWFLSLKAPDGSFAMHTAGERDTRSLYCVLCVSSLLNIMTPELTANTASWLAQCQTYEGGFSCVPDAEAHGGYTFCAVASLYLLGSFGSVDVDSLARWLVERQLSLEGGFSGRTNKLVDACYSFWIGGALAMVETATQTCSLFNRASLKTYILNCCQAEGSGGLRDKPGKHPDFYHTNYALCGLSLAEHTYTNSTIDPYAFSVEEVDDGTYTVPVNPVFGLPLGYPESCHKEFK